MPSQADRRKRFSSAFFLSRLGLTLRRHTRKLLLSAALFFLLWMVAISLFGPESGYESRALLKIEPSETLVSEGNTGSHQGTPSFYLLTSQELLRRVVQGTQYTLQLKNGYRSEILDSIHIGQGYHPGRYRLTAGDGALSLIRYNDDAENDTMDAPHRSTVSYHNLQLMVSGEVMREGKTITFSLLPEAEAVSTLSGNLEISQRGKASFLELRFRHRDPAYAQFVLTSLLEEYDQFSHEIAKAKASRVTSILDNQIAEAKAELDSSAQQFKRFKERYPWVASADLRESRLKEEGYFEAQALRLRVRQNRISEFRQRLRGGQAIGTADSLKRLLVEEGWLNPASSAADRSSQPPSQDTLLSKLGVLADSLRKDFDKRLEQLEREKRNQTYIRITLPARQQEFAELQRTLAINEQRYTELLQRLHRENSLAATDISDIVIVDPPNLPTNTTFFGDYMKYAATGTGATLVLFLFVLIVVAMVNRNIYSEEELDYLIDLPVLASIPVIQGRYQDFSEEVINNSHIDPRLITADYSTGESGEVYRSLRTHLLFGNEDKKISSLFLTSLNSGEGKSLTAGNLAITFAQQKVPTLLIDADLRRGVQHNAFACNREPGLTNFLYSRADVNEKNTEKIIQQTYIPNLYLLTNGMSVPNPSEILGSERCADVFNIFLKRFGAVIVDTPPLSLTADALIISRYLEAGLFLIASGMTTTTQLRRFARENTDFVNKFRGLLLNMTETKSGKGVRYSYYNY